MQQQWQHLGRIGIVLIGDLDLVVHCQTWIGGPLQPCWCHSEPWEELATVLRILLVWQHFTYPFFSNCIVFLLFPGRDQQKDQHSLLQEAEGVGLLPIQK